MASPSKFESIPPFPSDLPTIDIQAVPIGGFLSGDPTVANDVFSACKDTGFFLLDLSDDDVGKEINSEVDHIFDLAKDAFDSPDEVKQQHASVPGKGIVGWKSPGRMPTESGQKDRFEMYSLQRDGLNGVKDYESLMPAVEKKVNLLKSYLDHGQTIILALCKILETKLGLPVNTFADLHDPAKVSATALRLIKTPASLTVEEERTSMPHHTDMGTITILANLVGGLQILPSGDPKDDKAWRWLQPKPNHLIVNLGVVFVCWTGGILCSNVHRIRHAPGEKRLVNRYSFTIAARAASDAPMERKGNIGDKTELESDLNTLEFEKHKTKMLVAGSWKMKTLGGRVLSA